MIKNLNIKYYSLLIFGGLLLACSTKKDNFLNRHFHAATTKWNVLHNGKEALSNGRAQLVETYQDNYWETLPVERLTFKDEIVMRNQFQNSNFKYAEEKATKAIQQHSMNIKNRQRNYKIDEAYLLLGQARYYDQRFIPAIEAFNYIIKNYPESDDLGVARIWREKVNLRLENNELAIENLERLFRSNNVLSSQDYADANATMAQAYINLKKPDSAINFLKKAATATKKTEERARYNYILGQLYNTIEVRDTANMAFDKVISLNRRIPREYLVNAKLARLSNYEFSNLTDQELLEALIDMEENRENRPYLDKIYRYFGDYYHNRDSIDRATEFYNKSLHIKSNDRYLNALNYEDLARINFEQSKYETSGKYLDSTLSYLSEKTRKYRKLKKRLDNLADVIQYEAIARRNDSIIDLINMPEQARIAFFTKHINTLKAKIKADSIAAAKAKRIAAQNNNQIAFNNPSSTTPKINSNNQFYFYNTTLVAYGKNEFRRIWGNRSLEDNWRILNKSIIGKPTTTIASAIDTISNKPTKIQKQLSLEYYTNSLPKNPKVIDSIEKQRNQAYYQLGIIYKEKFKDYQLAEARLQKLLLNKPEEKYLLPAKYNLFKIYQTTGNSFAEAIKNDIVNNHPNSIYAQILLNPTVIVDEDSESPEKKYKEVFRLYQAKDYKAAIEASEKYTKQYYGLDIAPKFEMLKASAVARIDGFQAYKKALNQVVLKYPNSTEGKAAQQKIDLELSVIPESSLDTVVKTLEKSKLVFPFPVAKTKATNKLAKTIKKALIDLDYQDQSVSVDAYNRKQNFVVIHGFDSLDSAAGFAELLKINKDYRIDLENFVISRLNYRKIQIHKNLREYMKFYQIQ